MAKPTIDVSKLQTASLDELDPNSGQANKIEPSAYCKTNGEKYGDFPPVSWMNYWKNLVWQYLTWIVNEVIEGAFTFTGVKTFSSFPITPSSAPTTSYQVANKKYIDDGLTLKAKDNAVVHLTGNETVAGIKTLSNVLIPNDGISSISGMNVTVPSTSPYKKNTLILPLGVWNMDSTDYIEVDIFNWFGGSSAQAKIAVKKIISITISIINDGEVEIYSFNTSDPASELYTYIIRSYTGNINIKVRITRKTGGIFDGSDFDDGALNRGFLVCEYLMS